MKKKLLSFIFAICLIIPAAFMLSACGTKEKEPEPEAKVYTLTIIADDDTYKCEFTDENNDASIASILSENDIDIDYDNSIGFYWDAEFTQWQYATTAGYGRNITLYTKIATLDKININDGVVTAKSSSITGEVVVPFNATSLQIQDCDMSSLVLCHNIDSVSAQGLSTCDLLTNIKVVENREFGDFYSMDGVLFEYNDFNDISRLVKYPNKKLGTTYVVPKQDEDSHYIRHIGEYAFTNCTNIKTVDVNGLCVKARAFYDCDSLETVAGINGAGTDAVGDLAFANCDNLTEVSLLALHGSANAFDNCPKLERITAEWNVSYIWFSCNGCTSLKEIILDSHRVMSCETTTIPVIYVRSGPHPDDDSEPYMSTDFTDKYTKQATSDKTGYDKYVRNAE